MFFLGKKVFKCYELLSIMGKEIKLIRLNKRKSSLEKRISLVIKIKNITGIKFLINVALITIMLDGTIERWAYQIFN